MNSAGYIVCIAAHAASSAVGTSAGRRGRSVGAGTTRQSIRAAIPYRSPSLMAVPKQKQSHSRTNKRRSTHKLTAPAYNACPNCHSPRRPHRVCGVCGFYKGTEIVHTHHGHDHNH